MNTARQSVTILDKEGMRRVLTRIAHEIMERNGGAEGLVLVGVHTRGVPLARRIADLIGQFEGDDVPVRELDVTPYRDDRQDRAYERGVDTIARAGEERSGIPVEGRRIVLVDDVFYTGRTVRAAIEA